MNLKNALTSFIDGDSERAVSPVIGVILMVAITVILAAVIGTFVLGLGDRVSEASPNANFGFDYGATAGNADTVEITHDGGEGIEYEQVEVTIDGATAWEAGNFDPDGNGFQTGGSNWDEKVTAGDTLSIEDDGYGMSDGQEVRVIWHADGSDKTAVIGDSEVSI